VRAYAVSLLDTTTGKQYEGHGTHIRLGRGRQCEIRFEGTPDLIVSRVHAELTISVAGGLMVRDAGSRRGTFLNGVRLTGPVPVRLGDQLMLGEGGPQLVLEGLGTSPQMPVARRLGIGLSHRVRVRAPLVVLMVVLGAVVRAVYWLLKHR
jgi:pSer/pThr/pTyr-binding forkhead associated (FHA) protein